MTHETRIAKLLDIITKKMVPGWYEYDVPRIGRISVNCMTPEGAKVLGANQCWLRYGPYDYEQLDGTTVVKYHHELRGTAESVAKELCKTLKAPSKAVGHAASSIMSRWFTANPWGTFGFDNMRPPEVAAWLGLGEDATYRAFDLLEERGDARNDGARGYFRTTNA